MAGGAPTPAQRISIIMAMVMVGSAFLIDGLQFIFDAIGGASLAIPILGEVTGGGLALASSFMGIAADVIFFLWFMVLGVKYTDKNALPKLLTMAGMSVVTIIPVLDMLPEITVGVAVLIGITRFEDSLKDPKFAKKIGTAAKLATIVAPEAAVAINRANRVVQMQVKRQQKLEEQKQIQGQRRAEREAQSQAQTQPVELPQETV